MEMIKEGIINSYGIKVHQIPIVLNKGDKVFVDLLESTPDYYFIKYGNFEFYILKNYVDVI